MTKLALKHKGVQVGEVELAVHVAEGDTLHFNFSNIHKGVIGNMSLEVLGNPVRTRRGWEVEVGFPKGSDDDEDA